VKFTLGGELAEEGVDLGPRAAVGVLVDELEPLLAPIFQFVPRITTKLRETVLIYSQE
jgi:hypothetical protein